MTWRAYLGLTMQGAVGPELDVSAGSVAFTLNDHDEVSVTFSRASLDGVERPWWSVRAGCLLVTYSDAFGIERPVSACPISEPPTENRAAGTVTLKGRGVSWLFEERSCIDENSVPTSGDWRATRFAYRGLSFAGLIANILHEGMRAPNGYLPLVLPALDDPGTRERTYEAWNVANNGAWKRITEIVEVIGGPDVAFRPEWVDAERTRFQWRVLVGTDEQQTLPQDRETVWDGTVPGGDVSALSIKSDASQLAHRVYVTGAGEGAGVEVVIADAEQIPGWMPFVAHTFAVSGEGWSPVLEAKARAELVNQGSDQLSLTVRADPEQAPVGTWWCGETTRVVTKGALMVPDGEHRLRIIAASYSFGSDLVQIECQEDQLGEDYTW